MVALDVAGYSARTEADEARATAEVAGLRGVIEEIAKRHAGRVFNTAGDGFMLEFGSSLAAVEAALALAETCEPKVRVGVHLGDVVVQPNGDLLGHGVNVAARLMAQAAPGSALVSADVKRTIRGAVGERLVSRGSLKLDKMNEAIEAFALGTAALPQPAAHAPRYAEPILAVLPFDNLSDDREMQFFSDGVSEEILNTIARSNDLKVIGKASSFQFRGPDKALRKVAGELRATHVLDGSVRRAGNRVRISAQLVDAPTQTMLWTEHYDRELTDVFQLQDDLAAGIGAVLKTRLMRGAGAPAIDPETYDLFLKARANLFRDWSSVDMTQSELLLEHVVARAPDFAEAWGILAGIRVLHLPVDRDALGEPVHQAAAAAVERALRLDPDCSYAVAAQVSLKRGFGDYAEKLRLAERAAQLAPNDATPVSVHALALGMVGRNREAVARYRRCIEVEPLQSWPYALCAMALNAAGDTDAADRMSEAAMKRFPHAPHVWSVRLLLLTDRERWSEATALLDAGPPPGAAPEVVTGLRVFAGLAQMALAERERTYRALFAATSGGALNLALCTGAARLGLRELAFEELFKALDARRPMFAGGGARWFQAGWFFRTHDATMRNDPRFAKLCARIGLAEYSMASGDWPDCADEVPYDFRGECAKAAREAAKA